MTSIIIPVYDPEHRLTELTKQCVEHFVKNSRDYEILIKEGTGAAEIRMNEGFLQAKGDWIIWTSNDNFMLDPDWQAKMQIEGVVTCAALLHNPFTDRLEPETPFCIPRSVLAKIGLLDMQFAEAYGFSDTDFFHRVRQAGIEIREVPVKYEHKGSLTQDTYFGGAKIDRNKELFLTKWPEFRK